MTDGEDDKVGYGKPPKQTRFGQPGVNNRRGGRKPKKQESESDMRRRILSEKAVIKIKGREVVVTAQEALFRAMLIKGMNGSALDAIRVSKQIPEIQQDGYWVTYAEAQARAEKAIEKIKNYIRRSHVDPPSPEAQAEIDQRHDGELLGLLMSPAIRIFLDWRPSVEGSTGRTPLQMMFADYLERHPENVALVGRGATRAEAEKKDADDT